MTPIRDDFRRADRSRSYARPAIRLDSVAWGKGETNVRNFCIDRFDVSQLRLHEVVS
jgi:hypothetical protein